MSRIKKFIDFSKEKIKDIFSTPKCEVCGENLVDYSETIGSTKPCFVCDGEDCKNSFKNYKSTNESNDDKIRTSIKTALENMYMFGGMPKPDPNYDSYMNKMIDYVMKSIKEEYNK